MPRLTQEQRIAATETAKALVLRGVPRHSIVQNLAKNFGLKVRQCDNYLARARQQLSEAAAEAAPFAFGEAVGSLNMLLSKAVKNGDISNAVKIIQEKAKLYDLYPAQRHEHSWKRELVGLVNSGIATVDEVAAEFGDELAAELFGHVIAA